MRSFKSTNYNRGDVVIIPPFVYYLFYDCATQTRCEVVCWLSDEAMAELNDI